MLGFYDFCFFSKLGNPILSEKLESFKVESIKLETFHLSWKDPIEVFKKCSTSAGTFEIDFSQFYFKLSNLTVSNFLPTALSSKCIPNFSYS